MNKFKIVPLALGALFSTSFAQGGDFLIADFSNGTGTAFSEYSYGFANTGNGTKSAITKSGYDGVVTGTSGNSYEFSYEFDYDTFDGLTDEDGVAYKITQGEKDVQSNFVAEHYISECVYGISYEHKGAAHILRFNQSNITDYNHYYINQIVNNNWTPITVKLTDLAQGWVSQGGTVAFDIDEVESLEWAINNKVTTGTLTGNFAIRNIHCLAEEPEVPGLSSSSAAPGESSSSDGSVITGPVQLDNFAEGSNLSNLGEYFFIFTDAANDDCCSATITNDVDGTDSDGKPNYVNIINESGYIEMKGINIINGAPGYYSQAAIGLNTKNNGTQYDLSQCTNGFSYKFKGVAHRVSIMSSLNNKQVAHINEQTANTASWKSVTLEMSNFEQDPHDAACSQDGNCNVVLDFSETESIQWGARTDGTTGSLQISDIMCIGNLDLSGVDMPEPPGSSSSAGGTTPSSSSGNGTTPSSSSTGGTNPSSSSGSGNTPIISIYTGTGNIGVVASGNRLLFENLPSNAKIQVYNIHGQQQGTENLPKGLYLVKVNSMMFKVPVR